MPGGSVYKRDTARNNIKRDLKGRGSEEVDWIDLNEDRAQ
jgi:hypothetical protein